MLVPEIALTPAVAATFRRAFGDRVAIQHSGLSDGERHDQWQRIRRGDVDVVVGTRSTVLDTVVSSYTEYWQLVLGAILLALVLAFPHGLVGLLAGRRRE